MIIETVALAPFCAVDRYVPDEMTFAYAGGNPVMMVDPLGEYLVWGTTWARETR